MMQSVKSSPVLISSSWMIGACCLCLPSIFPLLKELVSIYFRHVWVLFLCLILPSPPKSPALLTLTYFYSFLLCFQESRLTNYFHEVRKMGNVFRHGISYCSNLPTSKEARPLRTHHAFFCELEAFWYTVAEFWLTPGDLRTCIQTR